jgi:FKBP-type peptidyl-prolyl cis-trans isomerase
MRRLMRARRLATIAISALALGLAACGDDSDGGGGSNSAIDGDPSTKLPSSLANAANAKDAPKKSTGKKFDAEKLQAVSTDVSKKPKIAKPPATDPPEELQIIDVVDGKGAAAKKGDDVEVQYVGVTFSEGKEFDASWGRPDPFAFKLGEGQVIKGWDEGVKGMKVGGRRQLVIPAEQAYGSAGSPPNIGPDEALVFVIDLKKIT